MKSILTLLVLCFALFGFSSARAATQEKEWTFMVFLNGDNNLDSYGTADMKEMEMVGSTDNVNVIVLRDTANAKTSSKIYYVQKGKSTMIKDFGKNIDMGDWHNVVDFFKFAQANYPAKHYVVDIWNHGAGWERRSAPDPITRGISYDDNSGNHITTVQLSQAFKEMQNLNGGKKIDVFGMDACLMEMAEVIYEVSDSVDVVVGSEQTEPGDGWAYQGVLGALTAKPQMTADELGYAIEQEYAKSYSNGTQGEQSIQGSAVSTARLVQARDAFERFVSHMIAISGMYHDSLVNAMSGTQEYYYPQYKDLIHFITLAKAEIPEAQFQQLADEAIAALKNAVIANFVTGSGLDNSYGFSVWIPTDNQYKSKKQDYAGLKWTQSTSWETFLESMLFPTTPVLSFAGVNISDENGDSFVAPGEKISFQLLVTNTSPIAAKDVQVSLNVPEAFQSVVSSVTVPTIPEGSTKVDGLMAKVGFGTGPGTYNIPVTIAVPGLGQIQKEIVVVVDDNYSVENVSVETPHNYPNNFDKTYTVSKSGAKGLRIHFAKFATEARFDYVVISDKTGKEILKLDGKKEPFWTPFIAGDTATIRLKSDSVVADYGFSIDKIAY